MKKIIKLTESDLTKLVKRILQEQGTRLKKTLYINVDGKQLDFFYMTPSDEGVLFDTVRRGSSDGPKFMFDCMKETLNYAENGQPVKNISKEGIKLLNNVSGCKKYVSLDNTTSTYV